MTETELPAAMRLDRRLSAIAGCSRNEAQQYIEGGWVSVDGAIVEEPQTLVTDAVVELAPGAILEAAEPATILVHKPAGVAVADVFALVTPETRAPTDTTGMRVLKRHFAHLSSPLELEDAASGLLVLTQDGRVRRRLTEDRDNIEQEFIVEIDGDLAPYGMHKLAHGLTYKGRELPPCKVSWQNEVRLRFAIKAVRTGQFDYMCAQAGFKVVSIKRLRIGRVALAKMPVGTWRYLPAAERF